MVQFSETHLQSAARPARALSLWTRWALFVAIGLVLYAGLYVWSENLVYRMGDRNRFFMIATQPPTAYDFVILGASHAMPLGFGHMNDKLQAESGASILNLSNEGAGVLPNRLVYDYFLTRHSARNVVYVLDSFVFNAPAWNEERVEDAGLYKRAPLDPALAGVLWRHDWSRPVLPAWLSGFGKINNSDRFEPDISDAERSKFNKTHRPSPKIDAQRVAYLYPADANPADFDRYFAEFEALTRQMAENGGRLIIVRPPTPARYRDKLPDQNRFEARLAAFVKERGIEHHDFSMAVTEDPYFYDTDHLNAKGVERFAQQGFVGLLTQYR